MRQRWIFGFNLPLCGVAFVVIPIFMKLRCRPGPLGFKLSQIDWIGSFIFVALMTTVLVPLIWAGVMYPWHHWKTVSHLVLLGLLGIVGFVLYSKQSLRDPLIRGSVFKSRTALINFFGTILHGTIVRLSPPPLFFIDHGTCYLFPPVLMSRCSL